MKGSLPRAKPSAETEALVQASENWVSLRQFIVVAKISYPTGIKWINERRIHATRRGNTWQISEAELQRFLKEGTRPPESTFRFPSQERSLEKRKADSKAKSLVKGSTFR